MTITSKELKRRARTILDGKYFISASMAASLMLATSVMSFLLQYSGFGSASEPLYQFFFWALWFIMLILGSLLEVGLVKFLYSLSQNASAHQPGVLFYAFKNQSDTFILASAFQYLITLIWFVPAFWKYTVLPPASDYTELFSSLLPILGLALAAVIPAALMALPFCMTNYVLLDSPRTSAREALLASWQLTRGYRKRIFLLWISFLPMCILGVGSYGIGFLWIRPYYHTTMNQLYLEMTGQVPEPVSIEETV